MRRETWVPISEIKKWARHVLVALAILKKNKRKLTADPARRAFQEDLAAEFQDSVEKLSPLLLRIGETDRLVDQIVYKLYGLSDEEIGIVEKSLR
jgi:hypothetical protein